MLNLPDEITVQPIRTISDLDALREISQYIASKRRWVSIAELAEVTVLPFEQIERVVKLIEREPKTI